MPSIKLQTKIKADINTVFDLSRSIDLHKISTHRTHEQAIAGKTSGLMELNDSVTWKAKHFGVYQTLTSKITEYQYPTYFIDEMVKGAFKSFRHEHHFVVIEEGTLMTDIFNYKSPMGILGTLADLLFLENYMTRFLSERNNVIKDYAESGKWEMVLNN